MQQYTGLCKLGLSCVAWIDDPPNPYRVFLDAWEYDQVCERIGVEPLDVAANDLEELWYTAKIWVSQGLVYQDYADEVYAYLMSALKGEEPVEYLYIPNYD
jgi:hypothetical protein